jgi:hypothetical protein
MKNDNIEAMHLTEPLTADHVIARVKHVQGVMRKSMKAGEHYGTIQGIRDNRKILFKSGAEKLAFVFRLAARPSVEVIQLRDDHREYRVSCELVSLVNGSCAGVGIGCASTLESKHRWRNQRAACPACGTQAIHKSRYDDGWYCNPKHGGCKGNFRKDEVKEPAKIENPDPADQWNTVLKMAKKRAFIDAILTATAASDIFAPDPVDDPEIDQSEEKASAQQIRQMFTAADKAGVDKETIRTVIADCYEKTSTRDLTQTEIKDLISLIDSGDLKLPDVATHTITEKGKQAADEQNKN